MNGKTQCLYVTHNFTHKVPTLRDTTQILLLVIYQRRFGMNRGRHTLLNVKLNPHNFCLGLVTHRVQLNVSFKNKPAGKVTKMAKRKKMTKEKYKMVNSNAETT